MGDSRVRRCAKLPTQVCMAAGLQVTYRGPLGVVLVGPRHIAMLRDTSCRYGIYSGHAESLRNHPRSPSARWAVAESVSETVKAAVLLLHERTVEEAVSRCVCKHFATFLDVSAHVPPPGGKIGFDNPLFPSKPRFQSATVQQVPSLLGFSPFSKCNKNPDFALPKRPTCSASIAFVALLHFESTYSDGR